MGGKSSVKVCFHRVLGYIIGYEGKVILVHGKISKIISSQETWLSYTERLEYYFITNDIQDRAKKKAILLTVSGRSTLQLLKNLLQPNTPESKSYSDLTDLLVITSTQLLQSLCNASNSTLG